MKRTILLTFFINVLFANVLFANVITLNSGELQSGTVAQGAISYYKITATDGDTVKTIVDGLADDADLYVKIGSQPTTSSYDCRSIRTDTRAEDCSVTLIANSDVFIGIHGYKATDYNVKSTIQGGNGNNIPTLVSGTAVSDSINKGETKYYKIAATQGQSIASLLSGLNDDADLYVKIGSKPTGENFDCKSTNGGTNNDECSVTLTQNADVYVAVYGYKATNYSIKATKGGDNGGGVTTLVSGTAITSSIAQGVTKYYKIAAVQGQNIASVMDQLTADADLYVRVGAKPTGELFDCKSTNGGTNNDGCSVTLNQNADVYIAVYGYQAANYRITATVAGNNVPTLTSGETVPGMVFQDQIKYYKINALFGQTIDGIINQLSADADIYIRKGSKPTTSTYDCKSTNGGTAADSCSIVVLDDMEVYIGVFGFRDAEYNLKVTATSEPVPANPTILEDAEGGTLNPNWITSRGDKPGYIFPTPDIPGAPAGTGVMVHHASGGSVAPYRYELHLNNSTQKVLSMDIGGLPDHLFEGWSESYRGYIPHYSVGVVVETKFGERIMDWNSWYTHQGYDPKINDNGQNVFLEYPSPVEMVRGWYAPTNLWVHFEVNLETELKKLEPNNRIYKITQFFTTGGYLDNITLSSAP
jgi:hypothetical protein